MFSPDPQPTLSLPVNEERDHILGRPDARVTLLEYGDFQCPHCGQAHLVLTALQEQIGDLYRFAFRHFPLSRIHPNAPRAAEASEAAGAQGRFWEMHDILFENQDALDDESLAGYAAELELDVESFIRDLASGVHAPRVREDFLSGVRSGVNGTPTFFINGVRHDGAWDLESLAAAIEGAAEGPDHETAPGQYTGARARSARTVRPGRDGRSAPKRSRRG